MDNKNKVLIDQQRISSLINSMTDAVIAVDENLLVQLYNSSALNLLDLNDIKLSTKLSDVFHPMDSTKQSLNLTDLVLKSSTIAVYKDFFLSYNDGSTINLYMSVAPVRENFGHDELKGYVIILKDITREKSLDEEKDEFISVVSHELRTPIAIAEGNISNAMVIVDKTNDVTIIKQALNQAHQQILFLSDLINDLSTLSRAERGIIEIKAEKIIIEDLLFELSQSYSSEVRNKGLEIVIDQDDKTKVLYSTTLYVKEILQNFITNAIKYSRTGKIVISAKSTSDGVNFSVKDSGIGISKLDQEKVFNKFFRSEDYRTREASGTGLGLYVSAKLAKLLNATITLDSRLNFGSTFTLHVPNLNK